MNKKSLLNKGLLVGLLALTGLSLNSKKSYGFFSWGKKKNKVVQLKGSDTILNLSQAVAEEFIKHNDGARVSVTGGGSGTGIAAKLNKTIDIAMASRKIKSKELDKAKKLGIDLKEVIIAFDGITVVVNKENPIKNLTKEQIRKIFIGEVTNWKELGGNDEKIIVLSRDSSSGTHSFFKKDVLRRGDKKAKDEYTDKALFLPSNEALKQEIRSSKGAIAYIGMGYMDDSVKSVDVDGIEATPQNVAAKKYPISRAVYWYINKEIEGTAKDLVDFMLSTDGQKIVAKEGFVPVK